MNAGYYESIIGLIRIREENHKIISLGIVSQKEEPEMKSNTIEECIQQLEEYFSGTRKVFTVPLELKGTEFQKNVWRALQEVAYGTTCSYKDLAIKIGNPNASRAIGMANHHNPIMIIVPCHRVIGTNGKLVGFACGLDVKSNLLDLEKNKN